MTDDRPYLQRRVDDLLDDRIEGIEKRQDTMSAGLHRLETRVNQLFGGLAVLLVVSQIVVPMLTKALGLPT